MKNLLMSLLKYQTPYKTESYMRIFLPTGGVYDDVGNYIYEIGESKTLFCCHLDTVGTYFEKTKLEFDKEYIRLSGNGKSSCLGGDDRCGILCLLALIKNEVPGTYIFHIGEEVGGIGASAIKESFDLTTFDRAIEFDRKGTTSVITKMGWERTCSDEFADDLIHRLASHGLSMVKDTGGSYTDVAEYTATIPEVTNLSVGYYGAHSTRETINYKWLINKFIPAILKIDWETLVVKRDPTEVDFSYYDDSYYLNNYKDGYEINDEYESTEDELSLIEDELYYILNEYSNVAGRMMVYDIETETYMKRDDYYIKYGCDAYADKLFEFAAEIY